MSLRVSLRLSLLVLLGIVAFGVARHADAQEPPQCLSMNPGDWPTPSRPYFMLAVDTSGSMTACTNPPTTGVQSCPNNAPVNSCGLEPTRYNDAKCALEQTILAFGGQVNFGLATYASVLDDCVGNDCQTSQCTPNNCPSETYNCDAFCFAAEVNTTSACNGCGPMDNVADPATRRGAHVRVPMLQDHFWSNPPSATNIPDLLSWTNGLCDGVEGKELYAIGATPLNGMLRDMQRYFQSQWCDPDNPSLCYPTPLSSSDLSGPGVNGSTGCRSVNVILITDGEETCDDQVDAVQAANALYATGVNVGGKIYKIRTHVINFAGAPQNETNQIAAAGGTGSSLFAGNEVQLAQGLAAIVAGAVQPEVCDNKDNNCNGCTDEGYVHHCNVNQTCCSWNDLNQRQSCLLNYEQSVITNPPQGNLALLPCTTSSQAQTPGTWLCYNPGDKCDELDNNCTAGVDEGQLKCGSPAHCPQTEQCNGQDDDCDAQIDEGVCGNCTPSTEVCDGCDNDCDGIVDDGNFPQLACGLPTPLNCQGTVTCQPPQPAPGGPGTCVAGAGYGPCTNNPQSPDSCDGIDNDCDQQIDEDFVSGQCPPPNNPPSAVYGGTSQCTYGNTQCQNGAVVCVGGTGPSAEICDGIDNDCNGLVDDNAFGVGQSCGINNPPCVPGTTACVNGVLVCQGGVGPQTETCDSIDNDCDGNVDEAPLADAPMPGQQFCWNLPGNCCSHQNLSWCPPPGANCYDNGTLSPPCNRGNIVCSGGAWVCQSSILPQPEVCDGIDNDCDATVDDNVPGLGEACGPSTPPCQPGVTDCVAGSIQCVGGVGPTQEQCNNIDDDCNTLIDDGIPAAGPCNVAFDANLYPNSNPMTPPCQQGQLECDGMGNWVCLGGVGPTPELCDGLDNDCDSTIDELGTAPDGITGTPNPLPPPAVNIGDSCGVNVGACTPGNYQCINGLVQCIGGMGAVPETCDCEDNDCDGQSDEPPEPNEPPLCSPGSDCVKASRHCQCAQPCPGGEKPCPPGQKCEQVELNTGGMGLYCVTDWEVLCGDCTQKTVEDMDGNVVCAPAGTDPAGCTETPECVCKGPNGCTEPCLGVVCTNGEVCSNFGPTPGECVPDVCYATGCPGCNLACHADQCGGTPSCVDNPCLPDSCPGEVAKPSADFTTCGCVPSCAGIQCPSGQKCQEGSCVPWCDPECADGEVCNPVSLTCVDSMCTPESCPNGAYCNPLNGACCDHPCEGVICPAGQICAGGECIDDGEGGAGGAGMGGAATTSGAGGAPPGPSGIWGLPTGGGGCGCRLGARDDAELAWLALSLMAFATGARRRRRRAA